MASVMFLATQANAACPIEKSTYSLAKNTEFSLAFNTLKEPKAWSALGLVLKTPSRTFAYEFTASNGYETFFLVSLSPQGIEDDSTSIYFFDKDLKTLALPQSGSNAPAYIFTPDLGQQLWYASLEPREYLPTEMWRLDGCME